MATHATSVGHESDDTNLRGSQRKIGVSTCAAIASWHSAEVHQPRPRHGIVVQHTAQALAPLDHACVSKMARSWAEESVGQPLVIALGVIIGPVRNIVEILHADDL